MEKEDQLKINNFILKFKVIAAETQNVEEQIENLKKKWKFINEELEETRIESENFLKELSIKYNTPLEELKNNLLKNEK